MTAVNKVESGVVGLTYSNEASPGVLAASPIFIGLEPNSFADFGATVSSVARNFINASRQRSKGAATGITVGGAFESDVTQSNMQDMLQGFFQANLRRKGEALNAVGVTTLTISATATGSVFTRVGGSLDLTTQFTVGDLVFTAGFTNAANNGLFKASSVTSTVLGVVAADGLDTAVVLVDESASSAISIVQVGVQSAVGDVDVDASGSLPALTSTTLDFTTLGIVPDEPLYIGGDTALTFFSGNAANNLLVYPVTITANRMTFWKTDKTMITEANTADLVHIYFGRVLQNETGSLINKRSVQFERTLGFNDDADNTKLQADYIEGAFANEFTLKLVEQDKIVADLSFVATGADVLDENNLPALFKGTAVVADAIKSESSNLSATKVSVDGGSLFNTSSDFSRIKLAAVDPANSNPASNFAFATEMDIVINNGVTPDTALGVFGAFDTTSGQFEVSGSMDVYFSSVAAIQSVQNNHSVTLDIFVTANNSGYAINMPLLTLADGRPAIELNTAIKQPLTFDAARGRDVDPGMDHTLIMSFFDYLPSRANV